MNENRKDEMKMMKKICALLVAATLLLSLGLPLAGAEASYEIRELCSFRGEYTDSVNNTYRFRFELPKIIGSTEAIEAANAAIDGIYDSVKYSMAMMKDGLSFTLEDAWWLSAEKEGITSLIVAYNYGTDNVYYLFFNFDDAGEKADNAAVLSAAGISEEEFTDFAFVAMNSVLEMKDLSGNPKIKPYWEEAAAKTLDEENLNAVLPMYLTEEGTLIFCARCYTPAGSGYLDYLFALPGENGISEKEAAMLDAMNCILFES